MAAGRARRIWVQPLVAKRVSSFHKRLLWHSDTPCDPAWLRASKAKENHVGLEQRQWYMCLWGMLYVGADVNSEELWISPRWGMHNLDCMALRRSGGVLQMSSFNSSYDAMDQYHALLQLLYHQNPILLQLLSHENREIKSGGYLGTLFHSR